MLILTHPSFRPAADALRKWKQDKGILASVFEVNDGAGPGPDTTDAIHQFIEDRVNQCKIRPSYLLLLGDAEFIPTYVVELVPQPDDRRIGTDYPYATVQISGQYLDLDVVADLAIARMPVDTLEQANTVVQKVIRYEQDPPLNPAFYRQATVASQFQCCKATVKADGIDQRDFVKTSEFVRDAMVSEGVAITAYQESADGVVAIGRASVVNGVSRLPFVNQPSPGRPILLSASKDGAVSRTL